MTALDFGAIALTSWRIAIMLVAENGPLGIARRIRALCGVTHDAEGMPASYPDGFPGSLFRCLWCVSAWTAAAAWGLYLIRPEATYVMGIWGAACLIESVSNYFRAKANDG